MLLPKSDFAFEKRGKAWLIAVTKDARCRARGFSDIRTEDTLKDGMVTTRNGKDRDRAFLD